MPKRSLKYIKEQNIKNGHNFFSPDAMGFKCATYRACYDHFIDRNYVLVRHYHGTNWYLFDEKDGSLTYITKGEK
jgi:hypothetical protein